MKKLLLLILLSLSGCATVTVETPDCKATYTAWFRSSEASRFEVCGGKATIKGSQTEIEAIVSILQAVPK